MYHRVAVNMQLKMVHWIKKKNPLYSQKTDMLSFCWSGWAASLLLLPLSLCTGLQASLKNLDMFLRGRALKSSGLSAKCPFECSSWNCWKSHSGVGLAWTSECYLLGMAFPLSWPRLRVLSTYVSNESHKTLAGGALTAVGVRGDGQEEKRGQKIRPWGVGLKKEEAWRMGAHPQSPARTPDHGHCCQWISRFNGPLRRRKRKSSLWLQDLWAEEGPPQ